MEELEAVLRGGDAAAILRHIRSAKLRLPSEVLHYGKDFVAKGTGARLGDEAWAVYEQVFLAALDLGEAPLADKALKMLLCQFPGSVRVERLVGMQAEAEGNYAQAESIYTKLKEENPTNPMVWKRYVAVAKAQGNLPEAIKRCNEYLKLYASDTSAWAELADMYVRVGEPRLAAFCYEELVLFGPANFAYHTALAELYHTLGQGRGQGQGKANGDSEENLRLARKHYAQALELLGLGAGASSGGGGDGEVASAGAAAGLRALFGMCATCHALACASQSQGSGDSGDGPVNAALFKLAAERIEAHYKKANPGLLPIVEAALKAQAEVVMAEGGSR